MESVPQKCRSSYIFFIASRRPDARGSDLAQELITSIQRCLFCAFFIQHSTCRAVPSASLTFSAQSGQNRPSQHSTRSVRSRDRAHLSANEMSYLFSPTVCIYYGMSSYHVSCCQPVEYPKLQCFEYTEVGLLRLLRRDLPRQMPKTSKEPASVRSFLE